MIRFATNGSKTTPLFLKKDGAWGVGLRVANQREAPGILLGVKHCSAM